MCENRDIGHHNTVSLLLVYEYYTDWEFFNVDSSEERLMIT